MITGRYQWNSWTAEKYFIRLKHKGHTTRQKYFWVVLSVSTLKSYKPPTMWNTSLPYGTTNYFVLENPCLHSLRIWFAPPYLCRHLLLQIYSEVRLTKRTSLRRPWPRRTDADAQFNWPHSLLCCVKRHNSYLVWRTCHPCWSPPRSIRRGLWYEAKV